MQMKPRVGAGHAPPRRLPTTRRVIKTNKQTNKQARTETCYGGGGSAGMGRVRPGAEERGSPLPGSAPPPPAGQTLTKGKRRCVRAAVNQSCRKDTSGKQARLPAPARLRTGRRGWARSPRGRARGRSPVSPGRGTLPPLQHRAGSRRAAAVTARGARSQTRARPRRPAGRGGTEPFPRVRAALGGVGGEAPGRCPPPP